MFFRDFWNWLKSVLGFTISPRTPIPSGPPTGEWSDQDLRILDLLHFIASFEAPRGYDQIYSGAEAMLGRFPLTSMTIADVYALQHRMKPSGSTAVGRYQFIESTLHSVVDELKVPVATLFDAKIQDRFAWRLLERRGLKRYLAGTMSTRTFANALAMEWAALPVQNDMQGYKKFIKRGESYYSGVAGNKALCSPEAIMQKVEAI